jgi:hypothetical protein
MAQIDVDIVHMASYVDTVTFHERKHPVNWNSRIAVAAVLASLSAPALAAEPVQDCTVCNDPTWPKLESPMPGIALNVPAETGDRSAIQGDATWLEASNRSAGVGAPASDSARGGVYSDPTWPQLRAPASGIATSVPVTTPAAAPRAAPSKVQVAGR